MRMLRIWRSACGLPSAQQRHQGCPEGRRLDPRGRAPALEQLAPRDLRHPKAAEQARQQGLPGHQPGLKVALASGRGD